MQLSFIQLGGGIATGVEARQQKYYSVLSSPERLVRVTTIIGVQTTLQLCSQLISNNIIPQIWNVGSVICDIMIAVYMTYYVRFQSSPIAWGRIKSSSFTLAAFSI